MILILGFLKSFSLPYFLLQHNFNLIIWYLTNNKYQFSVFLSMNKQSYPEFTGLELSPRKVDYLKFILEKGGVVKTTEISSRDAVDKICSPMVIRCLGYAEK